MPGWCYGDVSGRSVAYRLGLTYTMGGQWLASLDAAVELACLVRDGIGAVGVVGGGHDDVR